MTNGLKISTLFLLLTHSIVFGSAAFAAPAMTCIITRPGIPNIGQELVTVPFLAPYQREFPEQNVQLFIGFYEGLMQINLYERQSTGLLESVASARTHDGNSDVWLTSRRWHLSVHCNRIAQDPEGRFNRGASSTRTRATE